MTIKFIYTEAPGQGAGDHAVYTELQTEAAHLNAVIEAFKSFLLHIGHHPDNVDAITMPSFSERQGFTQRGDGNPAQGDFFDDGEESGV